MKHFEFQPRSGPFATARLAHAARSLALAALLCLGFAAASTQVHATWPTDPTTNLPIADRNGEQIVPKIAVTDSGETYVAWFDNAAGSYDVYLQHLDPQGNEVWPHNGILVSDHAQSSSLVYWDLIADSDGNAVVVFTDTRDGGDLDVFAYRVAPDGQFLWGTGGIQLSSNGDYEPAPVVTQASDGDFVFVWARLPSGADGSLRLQRVSRDGTLRLAPEGVTIASATGESPGFCQVVPSTDGTVIVSYVRDIDTFSAPRHVRCVRVEVDGTLSWGPVSVYDTVPVPIAYLPKLASDEAGGAIVVWHRSQSGLYNSLVQHLDVDGTELWPHNGVAVTTTPNRYHLNPAFSYDVATGTTLVFWNEEPTNQSQFGITGQSRASYGTAAIRRADASQSVPTSPFRVGLAQESA